MTPDLVNYIENKWVSGVRDSLGGGKAQALKCRHWGRLLAGWAFDAQVLEELSAPPSDAKEMGGKAVSRVPKECWLLCNCQKSFYSPADLISRHTDFPRPKRLVRNLFHMDGVQNSKTS